jgi:hypothetical protein
MNPRPLIYSSAGLLVLAGGWGWWSSSHPAKHQQDSVPRHTASLDSPISAAEKEVSVSNSMGVDSGSSSSSASAILSRGVALQEENRQVREKLAAGDLSALPETLKVADLPLETQPAQAVPASSSDR